MDQNTRLKIMYATGFFQTDSFCAAKHSLAAVIRKIGIAQAWLQLLVFLFGSFVI